MEITSVGQKQFKIKAKQSVVNLDEKKVVINDNFAIDGEGEYEVGGISVIKLPYATVIETDGVRLCRFQAVAKLTESQLEEIGSIDVVLVPTDGEVKTAAEIAKQLDPWVMIPDNFNPTSFLKEMGVGELNSIPKFSATGDKMPSELQIVVLENKGKDGR